MSGRGVVVCWRRGGDEGRYESIEPSQHKGRGRWGIHGGPWFLTCRCVKTGRGPGLGEITHLALDVLSSGQVAEKCNNSGLDK